MCMFRLDVPIMFLGPGQSAGAYIWLLFCSGLRVVVIWKLSARVYILHPILTYSRPHDSWIEFCTGVVVSRVDTLRIPCSQLVCYYLVSWTPRSCPVYWTDTLWSMIYCIFCCVGVTGTVCMLPSISFRINSKWFPTVVMWRPCSECLL